jgi:hypothetical protein
VVAIPKFIQMDMPSPPLKSMAQLRRGVVQWLEAQVHPLVIAIPRFTQPMVCVCTSTPWVTPCCDWAISFKGSKGISVWINLSIAFTRGSTCASITRTTPRRDWLQWLEAQVHPLVIAIPRFTQLMVLLPPLKSMGQLRRGVIHPTLRLIHRF